MFCVCSIGDMLTDEIAQMHRSPGFITSNLVGKRDDGALIKGTYFASVYYRICVCYGLLLSCVEFEASHGTVSDLWQAHLEGKETSMNPLGMVDALISAMNHSAQMTGGPVQEQVEIFTNMLRKAMHNTFRYGQGTRDMEGPAGLTTEEFIDKVARRLGRFVYVQHCVSMVGTSDT